MAIAALGEAVLADRRNLREMEIKPLLTLLLRKVQSRWTRWSC